MGVIRRKKMHKDRKSIIKVNIRDKMYVCTYMTSQRDTRRSGGALQRQHGIELKRRCERRQRLRKYLLTSALQLSEDGMHAL